MVDWHILTERGQVLMHRRLPDYLPTAVTCRNCGKDIEARSKLDTGKDIGFESSDPDAASLPFRPFAMQWAFTCECGSVCRLLVMGLIEPSETPHAGEIWMAITKPLQ